MHSHRIGLLMHSLRGLDAILVHVERLAALERLYVASVPGELARRSAVAYEHQGTLVVVADNGAVAAKLRHLAPRIVVGIVKSVPEVTSIRVEVQVKEPAPARRGRPQAKIGPQGLEHLGALRDSLADSPLKAALNRLVSRQQRLDCEDQALQNQEGKND